MRNKYNRILALLLACLMAMTTIACQTSSANLTNQIQAETPVKVEDLQTDLSGVADFYVRLFQNCFESECNTLISPLSVIIALSMTANGASGDTLAQMEDVLGLPADKLNSWIYTYQTNLPDAANCQLYPANSIWFVDKESFAVNEDFLKTNKTYYDADIFQVPFDEETTADINQWVNQKTEGMIPEILDAIPEDAVMYLINALAFDAKWQSVYEPKYVQPYGFKKEDGDNCLIDMMFSEEAFYLEDEQAVGFIKPYMGGKYAFAALLPEPGLPVADYVATLDGERLMQILSNARETAVWAGIPAFETEYDIEMSAVLEAMGMTDAFDGELADFSNLGTAAGNIYINRVLHKAYICVDEKGTQAAAATVVEAMEESGMWMPMDPKEVILDRPFVYMLIDTETNLPFFVGTLMNPEI